MGGGRQQPKRTKYSKQRDKKRDKMLSDILQVQETKEDGKKYKRQNLQKSKYDGRQNKLAKLGRYLDVLAKQKNG